MASSLRHCSRLVAKRAQVGTARGIRGIHASRRISQKSDLEIPSTRPAIRQDSKSDRVNFPGALSSKFTSDLTFHAHTDVPSLPTFRIIDNDGKVISPEYAPKLSEEEALRIYKSMLGTSIFDQIMFDSQRQGRISFYMVSSGEEAVSVGAGSALNPDDVVFVQYREQGLFTYRGFSWDEFMNQLFANKHDYGKGKNMPVHYQSSRLNIHPISSPLATQIPHAVGAGYALKREGEGRVSCCFFGEGAASEGDFHAALNMAATLSVPIVFICRNNGYAISTPSLEQYKGDGIASRGIGYGIETIRVDGNDVFAVREVVRRAREIAAKDSRPVLVEAMTYRIAHHSTSDDSFAYRSRSEVEAWKRRDDPISRMRKYLEDNSMWSSELEDSTRKALKKDIMAAFYRAEREKKPPIGELFEGAYKELSPELKRQKEELRDVVERYEGEYDVGAFEGGKGGI